MRIKIHLNSLFILNRLKTNLNKNTLPKRLKAVKFTKVPLKKKKLEPQLNMIVLLKNRSKNIFTKHISYCFAIVCYFL